VIAQTTGHKSMTVLRRYTREGSLVSGRGESHPPALAEPDVTVSCHPAPTGRPWAGEVRAQWTKSRG